VSGGDSVLARALELVAIDEVDVDDPVFTADERAYATSKSDPQRRLAARLAAKRAAVRALGGGAAPHEVEVRRGLGGPPRLRLSGGAERALRGLGGAGTLVSLTHGVHHAAASVLILRAR